MARLTCRTAGESHGPASIALIEGIPADLKLDVSFINAELKRRQGGYGRGGRQAIESDQVDFLGGVRNGTTTGAPIVLQVINKDSRMMQKQPLLYINPDRDMPILLGHSSGSPTIAEIHSKERALAKLRRGRPLVQLHAAS